MLTHLARNESVSASAQNQALAALLFLYRHVLDQPLEEEVNAVRAKQHAHIPTVLSPQEVRSLLDHMKGTLRLMAELTYGSGMRLQEVRNPTPLPHNRIERFGDVQSITLEQRDAVAVTCE